MYYRLRWFYISFLATLLMMLGYIYDISPLNSQIIKLNLKKKRLTAKIHILKTAPSIMIKEELPDQNKSYHTNDLITLIRVSGLGINKIIMASEANEEAKAKFNMQLFGEFQQLFALILRLKNYEYLTKIQNFRYAIKKNYLIINMDVIIYKQIKQQPNQIDQIENNKINKKSDNLFCLPHLIIH